MFRRLKPSLPKDPDFPADLAKLGYTIIDGTIRSLKDNEQIFNYRITNNGRYNGLNKQALTGKTETLCFVVTNISSVCVTEEISKQMAKLGTPEYYVPQMTAIRPRSDPNVTIFMTPQEELVTKDRVVIILPARSTELGCWSFYNVINDGGFEGNGCSVGLLRALGAQKDSPGLILLNTNQLYYSYEYNKALSFAGWMNRPRKSLYSPDHIVDPEYNLVPGNETAEKHVDFVLDNIVNNPDFVSPLAKLDIIGIADGGEDAVRLLRHNCRLGCFT
jgi:hypothetical protein